MQGGSGAGHSCIYGARTRPSCRSMLSIILTGENHRITDSASNPPLSTAAHTTVVCASTSDGVAARASTARFTTVTRVEWFEDIVRGVCQAYGMGRHVRVACSGRTACESGLYLSARYLLPSLRVLVGWLFLIGCLLQCTAV